MQYLIDGIVDDWLVITYYQGKRCAPQRLFAVLYGRVVVDYRQRFAPGCWMRSAQICACYGDHLFQTHNSVYYCRGPGRRMWVPM